MVRNPDSVKLREGDLATEPKDPKIVTTSTTTNGERSIYCDNVGITITLSSKDAKLGRSIVIKDVNGGAGTTPITIDTEGAETIDGNSSVTLSNNYQSAVVEWTGSEWAIFAEFAGGGL